MRKRAAEAAKAAEAARRDADDVSFKAARAVTEASENRRHAAKAREELSKAEGELRSANSRLREARSEQEGLKKRLEEGRARLLRSEASAAGSGADAEDAKRRARQAEQETQQNLREVEALGASCQSLKGQINAIERRLANGEDEDRETPSVDAATASVAVVDAIRRATELLSSAEAMRVSVLDSSREAGGGGGMSAAKGLGMSPDDIPEVVLVFPRSSDVTSSLQQQQ